MITDLAIVHRTGDGQAAGLLAPQTGSLRALGGRLVRGLLLGQDGWLFASTNHRSALNGIVRDVNVEAAQAAPIEGEVEGQGRGGAGPHASDDTGDGETEVYKLEAFADDASSSSSSVSSNQDVGNVDTSDEEVTLAATEEGEHE